MKRIALRRLQMLTIPRGEGMSDRRKLVLHSELAKMGYKIANPEWLKSASDMFFLDYQMVIDTLKAMKGGDVDYVPLFSGFPNEVPDDDIYFAKRIAGYLINALVDYPEGKLLENGTVVPEWLFDLKEFGADPMTQMQTRELFEQGRAQQNRRQGDTHTEWTNLTLIFDDELEDALLNWLKNGLYAKSSIKEALHEDVSTLLGWFGIDEIDPSSIAMKENRALVMRLQYESGALSDVTKMAKTPTDVLRLFAALTGGDISLGTPIRFPKLNRKQRRMVLSILETAPGLAEDLKRYRGLWLAAGRYLHPGSYRSRYPRVYAAFDALRNGRIETFDSKCEAYLNAHDLDGALRHLSKRPGVLGRKLHELLRLFPHRTDDVLSAFEAVSNKMTVKNLLVLRAYFDSINSRQYRTVINKRGKIKVLDNNAYNALRPDQIVPMVAGIDRVIYQQLGTRISFDGKTVWIDPALEGYTVPLQQRAASDGLLTYGRGSRIAVSLDKVLRLFVYWKQQAKTTDLDLSVIQFDDQFRYMGHVSYTHLSTGGIVHSGDLQSAPHGAAEFIDISLSKVKRGVRYLASQVYRYAGESFAEMTCHAGWMVRDKVDKRYSSFDIKTVQNKFDLNGTGGYCIPLVVDLKAQEVIVTDLFMGNRAFHNNVEGALGNVALAAKEIADFCKTRPTMAALAKAHVAARNGHLVAMRPADITFGIEGCDYNAADIEGVLTNLL